MVRKRSATSSGLVVELLVTSRKPSPRRRASARNPAAPGIGSRPVQTTPSRSMSTPFIDDQSSVTLTGYAPESPSPSGRGELPPLDFAEYDSQTAISLLQASRCLICGGVQPQHGDGHLDGAVRVEQRLRRGP